MLNSFLENIKIYQYFPSFLNIKIVQVVEILLHHSQVPVYLTSTVNNLGGWFNIKMPSYQYRKSHYGDKTTLRPSYLHKGISYTGKMSSLYWISAMVADGDEPCDSLVLFAQNMPVLTTEEFKCCSFLPCSAALTHWGRVTQICVGKLASIASDNGLSPGRRQAIIWNNAGILLIGPLGTNFSEILIRILTFSFMKMRLKVPSVKWRTFCLGLNVLKHAYITSTFSVLNLTEFEPKPMQNQSHEGDSFQEIWFW